VYYCWHIIQAVIEFIGFQSKMKNMKKYFAFFLLVSGSAFLSLMPAACAAAVDLLPPQKAIEDVSNKMKAQLQDKEFNKDFARVSDLVKKIIYPHVDFRRISALVLGKHWRKADKKQRARFTHEFQTMLVRTYARAFIEFDDWSIRYLPMVKKSNKKVIVKTEVLQPGKQPVAVSYRMVRADGDWKVYDIIIEGISLVTNYRKSFRNEMQRTGSLDAVIETLAQRNAKALSGEDEKKS